MFSKAHALVKHLRLQKSSLKKLSQVYYLHPYIVFFLENKLAYIHLLLYVYVYENKNADSIALPMPLI